MKNRTVCHHTEGISDFFSRIISNKIGQESKHLSPPPPAEIWYEDDLRRDATTNRTDILNISSMYNDVLVWRRILFSFTLKPIRLIIAVWFNNHSVNLNIGISRDKDMPASFNSHGRWAFPRMRDIFAAAWFASPSPTNCWPNIVLFAPILQYCWCWM